MNHGRITRRGAIAALGGMAFAQPKPPARGRPVICVYSGNLAKIPYSELPGIVTQMGYEGVDLTIMKGGHVDPALFNVDLDRAFQEIRDAGLELPMVSTNFTAAAQSGAYPVLYVSGEYGVRFFRLGAFPPATASQAELRGMMARNDLGQLAALGMRCKITPLLPNHAGSYPGRSIPEAEAVMNGIDPHALGYCFDPAQAVAEAKAADGWEAALRAALPRLGAVNISDIALGETSKACPLGEGVIDWKKFFAALAAARFTGPLSLHMEYQAGNDLSAMTKDLAFVRERVSEAWA